jgi:hypothetical protein
MKLRGEQHSAYSPENRDPVPVPVAYAELGCHVGRNAMDPCLVLLASNSSGAIG